MEAIENLSKPELISLVTELRREHAIVTAKLMAENNAFKAEIKELRDALVELQAIISDLSGKKTTKDSQNSSMPPSSDMKKGARRNQSLREKGQKRKGGQPGHKGGTLHPVSNPDKIVDHAPDCCHKCGLGLDDVEGTLIESRQVVDIPPITPIYIEHRCYSKKCKCGSETKGSFPKGVNSRIQYGPRIAALVAYFSVRQYISYSRIKEFFGDVMGLSISEGGIQCLIERVTTRSAWIYEQIKSRIADSNVAGADETGVRIAGKKGWFWTWQNEKYTYIVSSLSRGYQTVLKHFPDGLPRLVLVQDCWSAHFKTPARLHQMCHAHLLRDLKFIIQIQKSAAWANKIKKLILEAMEFKKQLSSEHFPLQGDLLQKAQVFEQRLDTLLNNTIPIKHKEALKLQKRLVKRRESFFPFLYYHFVPPDNNGSERAIRNLKVKSKVSGQFRSEHGAHCFAVIRSVIDTSIKSGQNVLNSLATIAQFG